MADTLGNLQAQIIDDASIKVCKLYYNYYITCIRGFASDILANSGVRAPKGQFWKETGQVV